MAAGGGDLHHASFNAVHGAAGCGWRCGGHETLTCTGEHPFWIGERQAFVPIEEARVGWHVLRARGAGEMAIIGLERQEAAPGRTFTTYNFEVGLDHTYFVGDAGVWVHNLGKSPCEEVFSAVRALLRGDQFNGRPWAAFDDVAMKMGQGRNSAIFGWAADEVMRKDLKDLSLGERFAQWPSHAQVKATMSKVRGPMGEVDLGGTRFGQIDVPEWVRQERIDLGSVRSFTLESHHGVPKKVQEWLGLTKDPDSVPAYLTTMLEHRGADVGIHQRLSNKLGELIGRSSVHLNEERPIELTDELLVRGLRETYQEANLAHFWQVCEVWLDTP